MSSNETYIAEFHDVVLDRPDRLVLSFLPEGTVDQVVTWTNADLYQQASRIAVRLREVVQPGDRVLLLTPPGLDYVAAFFGCLYAGAVAVPVYPPAGSQAASALDRLHGIAADAQAAYGLTTTVALPAVTSIPIGGQQLDWLAVDELSGPVEEVPPPALSGSDLAFLQYTSGSTGAPRGVMVTQGNLLANTGAIRQLYPARSDTGPVVSWLPPYHDMGLIGKLLAPPLIGLHSVSMSPSAFLRRPVRWLEAVTHFRAQFSGAPNFAYESCVLKVSDEAMDGLDLSSWEVAFSGAEPIRAATLERFTERFAPVGFRASTFNPCYGLAEATLIVTGGRLGENANVVELDSDALAAGRLEPGPTKMVTAGVPVPDVTVRIIDPVTSEDLPEGRVVEIVVEGPHVTAGYWGNPAATSERFVDGGLRTGDLGCLLDGELLVTGRIKDLLVLRGRNHYPQDIEATVESAHDAIRRGSTVAVSVDHDDAEQLVVLAEIVPAALTDPDGVVDVVRRAVTTTHAVAPGAVVLLRPGTVPKTSSGKVRRSHSRTLFEGGELEPVVEWRSAALSGLPGQRRPSVVETGAPAS